MTAKKKEQKNQISRIGPKSAKISFAKVSSLKVIMNSLQPMILLIKSRIIQTCYFHASPPSRNTLRIRSGKLFKWSTSVINKNI